MRSPSACLAVAAIAVLLLTCGRVASAQAVDPAHHFRTIRTDHFAIHFHQGADPLAATLATIAEETWRRFDAREGSQVPALTHVVLTDQSESANGFATTLPRNTIVVYASAPAPAGLLNPDDWLRTLFVHEFTHIVHLDQNGGWARAARALFGRAPWTFPNFMLPLWQIEGLATFEEGRREGTVQRGRLHAGDFQAITRQAARTGSFEPIDRVGGGLIEWPGGLSPYAYGLAFHVWLADRHGPESFQALSDRTARSLPWLGTRSFRRVYGRPVGDLWKEFAAEAEASASATTGDAPAAPPSRRLTTHGFQTTGPRYLPRRCATCDAEVVYALRTPHERPGLYVVSTDVREPRRLTTRFLGSTTSPSRTGALYFDQQEQVRNAGLYSDLYVLSRDSGRVRRLTTGARLMDPDLAPDEETLVAVQHTVPGRRDLVRVGLGRPERSAAAPATAVIASEPGVQFNTPRWSPDGRHVVAVRQPAAGPAEIVVVDVDTGHLEVITTGSGMRWATPAWRPDGRAVIAAGASGDDPFDLYEVALDTRDLRRLTTHPGGATWPDVAGDGGTIVYVGYSIDGFDLYEMPYVPAVRAGTRPAPAAGDAAPGPAPAAGAAAGATPVTGLRATPYQPWSTLLPTSWTPIVTSSNEQVRAGAVVAGRDVLGYHAWSAAVAWPVVDRVRTTGAGDAADWNASYVYGRWRPRVWTAVSRTTSFFPVDADTDSTDPASTLVEHVTEIGVQVPVRRLRSSQVGQVSVVRAVDTFTQLQASGRRNRSGLRAAWRFSNVQFPSYGVSPERGVALGVATEFVRPAFGASGRAGTLTADVRAYAPGFARHHVLALRAARAITWGEARVGRLFVLGGGDASSGPGTLSSESMRLLRGFPANTFAGRQAVTINVDYRLPLAHPQRGLGAWPFFVHSVHGAVVADAGHVWSGTFNRRHVKTSVGVELAANVVVGYGLPLTVAGGVARGYDGERSGAGRTTAYARIGYAF